MPASRESIKNLLLYHLFKWPVVNPIFRLYLQGSVYGVENVPREGPLVVASNHASYADPPVISNCLCRPVAFMAKEELFRHPIFRRAIALYGAYPVKRGGSDKNALKSALSYLERGWATGIFLQGTRTGDGCITAPKVGAALIAAKARVPLLPVSLWGTEKILLKDRPVPQPAPVTVRIGKPIDPPASCDRAELEAVTQKCAEIVNEMHALAR